MSHGTYLFVLDPGGVEDASMGALEGVFNYHYGNRYCDENNWSSILFLVRPGKPTVCFDKSDRSPPTYEEVLETAWGIAVHDLRLVKNAPTMNIVRDENLEIAFEQLKARGPAYLDALIRQEIPKRIAQSFVPGETRTQVMRFTDDGVARWQRDSMVEAYRHYNSSYVPPFAHYLCEPENWRLFDLRSDAETDKLDDLGDSPILGVDIHT